MTHSEPGQTVARGESIQQRLYAAGYNLTACVPRNCSQCVGVQLHWQASIRRL